VTKRGIVFTFLPKNELGSWGQQDCYRELSVFVKQRSYRRVAFDAILTRNSRPL